MIFFCSFYLYPQGQFKIGSNNYIQIGYTGYKALTFGQSTSTPNNGSFAIEHCLSCSPNGLNIWKPWPTAGAANYLLFIRDNGNVGIGNSGDQSIKLNVSGSVRATSFLTFSDERFKENMLPLGKEMEKIGAISVYSYTYRPFDAPARDSLSVNVKKENVPYAFDGDIHFGVKAKDIMEIYPELVKKDENGFYSVNYIEFIPILISVVQEQNEKIRTLEKIISELKDN